MSETQVTFDHVHPSYERMYWRWVMSEDFWRGGQNVISPDRYKTQFTVTVEPPKLAVGSDDAASGINQTYKTTSSEKSYLWKNEREEPSHYLTRRLKAVHIPVYRPINNILAAGVLRVGPTRGEMSEEWAAWMKDVDMAGTNYDAFIRETLARSLNFGRYHAMADRPYFDSKAVSRYEQTQRGERAYLVPVSPLCIEDWEVDYHGALEWVRITEPDDDMRGPTDPYPTNPKVQYRVLRRDGWELWRNLGDEKKQNWTIDAGRERNYGRVQLATHWSSREHIWECESPIGDAIDLDREIFNLYSQLGVLEDVQAFALLYLPVEEGGGMGPIDIGADVAFQGPPGGAPVYVSPGSDLVNAKWDRIEKRIHLARQQMGIGRGRAEYSKEERSADAIMRESEDKLTMLSVLSQSTEEFDQACLDMVAALEGKSMGEPPAVNYPRNFDTKGTSAQINELLQLGSVDGAVPQASMITLAKPIVANMLKEKGVDQKIVDATLRGMDAEIQRAIETAKSERAAPEVRETETVATEVPEAG
jgi:hypothetical protein